MWKPQWFSTSMRYAFKSLWVNLTKPFSIFWVVKGSKVSKTNMHQATSYPTEEPLNEYGGDLNN
jgi:hypothetical protein